MMTTYYAVCNVNGPISHEIQAESLEDAVAQFGAADTQQWIDDADTDAEDDLDIEDASGMSEGEFEAALEAAGCTMVRDLSPVHNYHAGTSAHLSGGWELWKGPSSEETTVCGNVVQLDKSGGQGHCWRTIDRDDISADILMELEGEMIDGGKETCESFRASDGQYYRW
jgi:hypothetical protein